MTAPRAHSTSASLASRTNWNLAAALPASADFPVDWGYSLTGRLQRNATSPVAGAAAPRPQRPEALYAPSPCSGVPKVLNHFGDNLAAYVQVDRYAQLVVPDAPPADAAATGEGREHGPNARFAITDFPASWTVSDINELSDTFGYFRYHVSDEGLGFTPVKCFAVVGVASTGAFDAAEVFGHDPADPAEVADRSDIRLTVGREFDPTGFDAFTGLVSRCHQQPFDAVFDNTLRRMANR
nr:hypothetical protein [Mycobacterium simiae]